MNIKVHELRTKGKSDLVKQLDELKSELASLRVAKVTGGAASKLSKMYALPSAPPICDIVPSCWSVRERSVGRGGTGRRFRRPGLWARPRVAAASIRRTAARPLGRAVPPPSRPPTSSLLSAVARGRFGTVLRGQPTLTASGSRGGGPRLVTPQRIHAKSASTARASSRPSFFFSSLCRLLLTALLPHTFGARSKVVRKSIARVLTVINQQKKDHLRNFYKDKDLMPLDLRAKKTRALRRALTKKELSIKTTKAMKKEKHYPQRKYALKA